MLKTGEDQSEMPGSSHSYYVLKHWKLNGLFGTQNTIAIVVKLGHVKT